MTVNFPIKIQFHLLSSTEEHLEWWPVPLADVGFCIVTFFSAVAVQKAVQYLS